MFRRSHPGNSMDGLSRRELLKSAGIFAAASLAAPVASFGKSLTSLRYRVALLNELQRRACLYFIECADPVTGLVLDRARSAGREDRQIASIAATGFGLSAMCIAESRGYLKEPEARAQVERTLYFLARRAFHHKGFYFHFLNASTGQRAFNCELSSIDTAWLLCGVIHARQHFESRRIRQLAGEILTRVDWRWMLAGEATLCHGWTPESGFLAFRWDQYSELLAMYLLAIGSMSHPVPVSSWDAWERPSMVEDRGDLFIASPAPLFVHQYSHAWFDFRNRQDGYANYFLNSRTATLRHRDFCLSLRDRFPWIGEDMWGITASDSRFGYIDWGGPGTKANNRIDGTLVPCATGGSLVFLPDECSRVLETMMSRYGKQLWSRYGFIDAFHPQANWWAPDVLGIDLGIMLMMAENLRTESVWKEMSNAPEVRRGLQSAGFYDPGTI